jgi:hypothetical protein
MCEECRTKVNISGRIVKNAHLTQLWVPSPHPSSALYYSLFNRTWDVCKGYPETTGVCFEVESLIGVLF